MYCIVLHFVAFWIFPCLHFISFSWMLNLLLLIVFIEIILLHSHQCPSILYMLNPALFPLLSEICGIGWTRMGGRVCGVCCFPMCVQCVWIVSELCVDCVGNVLNWTLNPECKKNTNCTRVSRNCAQVSLFSDTFEHVRFVWITWLCFCFMQEAILDLHKDCNGPTKENRWDSEHREWN